MKVKKSEVKAVIDLFLDEKVPTPAKLILEVQSSDIALTFVDREDQPIATDLISQFTEMELPDEKGLIVILKGSFLSRKIVFHDERDRSKFLQCVKRTMAMEEIDSNHFSLQQSRSKFGMFGRSSSYKGMEQADGLSCKFLERNFSSDNLRRVKRASAETCDLERVDELVNLDIDDDAYSILLRRFLKPVGDRDEYNSLKRQWNLVSVEQWNHCRVMRTFVKNIDEWLEKPSLDSGVLRTVIFNVCMSLFMHYTGELEFKERLQCLISCMVKAYFIDLDADAPAVFLQWGGSMDPEQAEFMVFKMLRTLVDFVGRDTCLVPTYRRVQSILEDISPSTATLLVDAKIRAFDFAKMDFEHLFMYGRPSSDYLPLLLCALWVGDISKFTSYMFAIILILLEDKLQPLTDDPQRFVSALLEHMRSLETRLLIGNCTKLLKPTKEPNASKLIPVT